MAVGRTTDHYVQPYRYASPDILVTAIRRFARQIGERIQPDTIILFGSYAYGTLHTDSDVDILVVVPTRNQLSMAARISIAIDPPFPLDIIVRTPKNMKWRLEEGDSFLREVVTKGKVLYAKADQGVGQKGRSRLRPRHPDPPLRATDA